MEQFEELYRNHGKLVYGFLLKLCHDPDLSEDLTQETFLVALKKSGSFDGSCKVSTWLCGIARNLWLKERRRRKSVPLEEEVPYEDQLSWESVDILRKVHELREPYKEVIYLRLVANLSFAQIGEIMGKSENWARVTFYRGKNQLKEGMEP